MLRSIGLGFVLGFAGIYGLASCSSATLAQCRLQAVAILPADPDEISVGVARELARRVKECEAQPDGGAQ